MVLDGAIARPAPLPPGFWSVPVFRGPHFESSGFGPQDGSPGKLGTALKPSKEVLQEWAKYWFTEGRQGTWSPYRSAVVRWQRGGELFYYKANDKGAYDLGFSAERTKSADFERVIVRFERFVLDAARENALKKTTGMTGARRAAALKRAEDEARTMLADEKADFQRARLRKTKYKIVSSRWGRVYGKTKRFVPIKAVRWSYEQAAKRAVREVCGE